MKKANVLPGLLFAVLSAGVFAQTVTPLPVNPVVLPTPLQPVTPISTPEPGNAKANVKGSAKAKASSSKKAKAETQAKAKRAPVKPRARQVTKKTH